MSVSIGKEGEDLACEILRRLGLKILERNYRTRAGEIDIIAKTGKMYIFVEVKYKKDMGFGLPEDAVTRAKLERIRKTAEVYLFENRITPDWRIDVISIDPDSKKYHLFENVFTPGLA